MGDGVGQREAQLPYIQKANWPRIFSSMDMGRIREAVDRAEASTADPQGHVDELFATLEHEVSG